MFLPTCCCNLDAFRRSSASIFSCQRDQTSLHHLTHLISPRLLTYNLRFYLALDAFRRSSASFFPCQRDQARLDGRRVSTHSPEMERTGLGRRDEIRLDHWQGDPLM